MSALEQLSKYEACRLLGRRMLELQQNSPPAVPVTAQDTLFDIARREFDAGLKFTIRQEWPGEMKRDVESHSLRAKKRRAENDSA